MSFWLMKRRAGQVGDRPGRDLLVPMLEGLGFKAPRCHPASHSFGAKLPASAVLAGVRSEIALVDELERPTHSRRRFTVGY